MRGRIKGKAIEMKELMCEINPNIFNNSGGIISSRKYSKENISSNQCAVRVAKPGTSAGCKPESHLMRKFVESNSNSGTPMVNDYIKSKHINLKNFFYERSQQNSASLHNRGGDELKKIFASQHLKNNSTSSQFSIQEHDRLKQKQEIKFTFTKLMGKIMNSQASVSKVSDRIKNKALEKFRIGQSNPSLNNTIMQHLKPSPDFRSTKSNRKFSKNGRKSEMK